MTLEELDLTSTDLDGRLITLECNHVFTVETLDGVCGIKDYYKHDGNRWVEPTLPPPGSVKSPVCPQCRGEIRSPRYGRVLKRCNLDLQERTVAADISNRLQRVIRSYHDLDLSAIQNGLLSGAPTNPGSPLDEAKLLFLTSTYQNRLQENDRTKPFQSLELWGRCLQEDYGFQSEIAQTWNLHLQSIRTAYVNTYSIATTQSAHRIAYERSLSQVYRHQLELMSPTSESYSGSQEVALHIAKIKVGMTPPAADRRFFVEAIWLSIDLRLMAASVTMKLQAKVFKAEKDNVPVLSRVWNWMNTTTLAEGQSKVLTLYIQFLHDTCLVDAELALKTARSSGAHRQALKSELKVLRIRLEQFNLKVHLLENEPTSIRVNKRKAFSSNANEEYKKALRVINDTTNAYFKSKGNTQDEQEWVEKNFMQTAREIAKSWEDASRQLASGTFYQPVSIEEKRQIQQAFGFSKY